MEEGISLNQKNNSINSVTVKEDKKLLAKIWDKMVDLGVSVQETKINMRPTQIKILSVFCPELKPIVEPVTRFYESDSGKKYLEGQKEGIRIAGNVLKGDTDEAKKQCQEMLDSINSENGDNMVNMANDINGMLTEIKEAGGMQR